MNPSLKPLSFALAAVAMILILETSGNFPSVGIIDTAGNELYFQQFPERQSHAEQLAVMVQEALQSVRSLDKPISAIAINDGPGSYTGLRIGCSFAKGLCMSLQLPLISVSGMAAMGDWFLAKQQQLKSVWVMLDARRDEVYALKVNRDYITSDKPSAMILPHEFLSVSEESDDRTGFVGDCMDKVARLLGLSEEIIVQESFVSVRHLYSSALYQFSIGDFRDLAYYEPFYLKEFQAGISKKYSLG